MLRRPTKLGFAVPAHEDYARHYGSTLPALLAMIALGVSIAAVLTAITMNVARATHLF